MNRITVNPTTGRLTMVKGLPKGARKCTSGSPVAPVIALGPYEMRSFVK